jgi:hypothetical protein
MTGWDLEAKVRSLTQYDDELILCTLSSN